MTLGQPGVSELVDRCLSETASGLVVLAIDGYSGSGKSTLAMELAEATNAALVQGDDFYRVMDEDVRAALSPREGMAQYFDWQRLRDLALVPLARGQAACFRPYDWIGGRGLAKAEVTITPAPVVIVDGVYSGRPELEELVTIAVRGDTDAEVRRSRIDGRRRAADDGDERWDAAESHYFSPVRPPSSFDVVVPGD